MFGRLVNFCFTAVFFVFTLGAICAAYVIWTVSEDLPDYEALALYEPPVMSRVHASDGVLLAEFAEERRLFVPIGSVPRNVVAAFLSAEDKNFYEHGGIDYQGVARALLINVQNKLVGSNRLVGASTITQQVAKNFLLSSEQTLSRKLKEFLIALKIEKAFSKDEILELYLNEIFFGLRSYGIASAALNYFGKPLTDLNLPEMAYLAALPKAPNNYHPYRYHDRAVTRRNWVIDRMVENGFVGPQEAEEAKSTSLEILPRASGTKIFAAESFAEEVRRESITIFGEKKLNGGGLSIRTTLDPKMQRIAKRVLVEGLVSYDRSRGWRGSVGSISVGGDWGIPLAKFDTLNDIAPWRMAAVLEVQKSGVIAGLRPITSSEGEVESERHLIDLPFLEMKWARSQKNKGSLGPKISRADQVVSVGDVIYVAPTPDGSVWRLMQVPKLDGALVALDPHNGRVHAMVGGFSYDRSQFNRAVQAKRQPGSSFKPFVYAAALDNGYTPASVVMDAPFAIDQGNDQGIWRPQNYGREYFGPSTLRLGIEKSRNVMTVRLAEELGMDVVADYGTRFGIYDNLPLVLSMALGAGETTLLKLTTAYAMIANGGKRIVPTLIDRVQDRFGKTVFRHDQRLCGACAAQGWTNQAEPILADEREQVLDPHTAYQITSMLEGVVKRGTASAIKTVGKPIAGKTGTTNNERDAWFVGYTPDLTVGVYVGFDKPESMGKGATGGGLAAPIVRDFLKKVLVDSPAIPFRVPPGINLVRVNAKTGTMALPGDKNVIVEAFKPGSFPEDNPMDVIGSGHKVIDTFSPPLVRPSLGMGSGGTVGRNVNGVAGSAVLMTGTGGLY
jgi:penicillin-binding protein 1A